MHRIENVEEPLPEYGVLTFFPVAEHSNKYISQHHEHKIERVVVYCRDAERTADELLHNGKPFPYKGDDGVGY